MQVKTKVQKLAGSLYVRIPSEVRDELGISKSDTVSIDVEHNKMTVELLHTASKQDAVVEASHSPIKESVPA